ncbi:hypothetical protein IAQ61_008859 [Plenodomus lingam]|uniref:uncharacterized protein n=1 Tax=Leptosphaeria maculans TaxID=5022 RepID=UPI0033285EA9|nr:hypothetical protein IAQ61_008859 [Plenodomus lingam]
MTCWVTAGLENGNPVDEKRLLQPAGVTQKGREAEKAALEKKRQKGMRMCVRAGRGTVLHPQVLSLDCFQQCPGTRGPGPKV